MRARVDRSAVRRARRAQARVEGIVLGLGRWVLRVARREAAGARLARLKARECALAPRLACHVPFARQILKGAAIGRALVARRARPGIRRGGACIGRRRAPITRAVALVLAGLECPEPDLGARRFADAFRDAVGGRRAVDAELGAREAAAARRHVCADLIARRDPAAGARTRARRAPAARA